MAKNNQHSPIIMNLGQGLSLAVGLPTISSWDSAGRPKNPKQGTIGFNFQTSNIEYWDGESWLAASMSRD